MAYDRLLGRGLADMTREEAREEFLRVSAIRTREWWDWVYTHEEISEDES